ncbi:hypothetical protein F511_47048 [Dorcoceras hygrometricum]|uniref:Uncharacterized protein n=1 Tax=Dorcoceras hygrometricum TaxID=472368 RepID=A0A2Z6ZRY5_9LAMI|nr:hypothetical protein F511_47048 [Dorcoceras hygrometricum]
MAGDTLRVSSRAGRATRTLVAAPLDSPGANRCAAGRDVRAPRAAAACRGRTSLLALVACLGRWLAARRCTRWRDREAPLRATMAARLRRRLGVRCTMLWRDGRARCALDARRCARHRAPPCDFFVWRPPLRRCSGEFPAMS